MLVELLDALDQVGEGHGFGVGEAARGQLVPGMPWVQLALEGPEHIVGIERAGGGEPGRAVERHPLAQLELVDQAVGTDAPAFRQARLQASGAGDELHQAVEEGFSRGVGGSGRGVLDDIEPFRAGLGADHQARSLGGPGGATQGQRQREGSKRLQHRISPGRRPFRLDFTAG
ncbi:hypothetical protein D3C78_1423540 [compost metagenome]